LRELEPGSVAEAGCVVDAQTGERYGSEGLLLATTASIASVAEKARLAASYGAAMVDMEAATVARLARAHGLGFRAVKGISDAHDFELEGLSKFAGPRGTFRTGAFALHTMLRPGTWGKAMELGKNSKRALVSLTERLEEILREDSLP
jgi:adenosylhomocysteine nucleosidase